MLSFKSGFASVKQPALEPSKRPALMICARGASPSMRERRINETYDASWTGQVASLGSIGPVSRTIWYTLVTAYQFFQTTLDIRICVYAPLLVPSAAST
jgi:hypothetical protein